MTEKLAIRRIKLAAVAAAAALIFSHMLWQMTEASSPQQPARPFDLIGYQTPASERPGTDDGAVTAIHFSGDIHGTLEPCG